MTNYFSPENFKKLEFNSPIEADSELRIMAKKNGFEISDKDIIISGFCRYYCHKGGKKRGKNSNKTDCPFCFRTIMSVNDDGSTFVKIDEAYQCLEHNHALIQQMYTLQLANNEVKEMVQNMMNSDISPVKIRKFLFNQGINDVSTLQIRQMQMKFTKDEAFSETDELIKYVKEKKGFYKIFEETVNNQCQRFAVFTLLPEEFNNLKSFGDVILIDSTQVNLSLKWEVVPITLIDRNKNLRCGGIVYTCMFSEEIITWLLKILLDFDAFREKIQTIITDENAAFIVAFDRAFKNAETIYQVKHVLCSFHKTQNFKKKINSLGLTSHQKDCLNDLFETICYTPHYDTAMSCLGKLFDVVELKSYLSKEVVPYLHMFARSCINESFCLGYNVTSPAESMNYMLKRSLPARTLTLSESRKEFDSILYNHYQCISEKQHKKRIPSDNIFYEHYSPNIANEIMHQIEKSKTVILEDDHFDNYTHVAYQQEFQNQKYRLNEWYCECKLNYFSGVPCSHIISLHSKLFNEYPFFLIDPRWKISNNNITISNDDVLNLSSNLVEESNDISIPLPIKLKQETYDPYSLSTLTQEQRFLRTFHIAKQLCSAAACDINHSCMVMEKFKKLLDHVQNLNKEVNKQNNDETCQSNDTNVDDKNNSSKHNDNSLELIVPKTNTVVDHCDIIGKRKRRPKKPRKAKEHSQNIQCIICLGKHHMKDCFFYNELEKLLKEQPLDDPGKRKCGLCRHFDHIIKTCPLRLKGVEYYKNET